MRSHALVIAALTVVVFSTTLSHAADSVPVARGATDVGWKHYSGDAASTKYSTVDQISDDNGGQVKLGWSWESPDLPLQKENRALGSFAYETTPLAVGNTLYISTSLAQVAAVDGRTGKNIWVFNPEVYKAG